LIRKPILEHKEDSVNKLKLIYKSDNGHAHVVDKSKEDEEQLRDEIEQNGGEIVA
jgi:hypothetical protein